MDSGSCYSLEVTSDLVTPSPSDLSLVSSLWAATLRFSLPAD